MDRVGSALGNRNSAHSTASAIACLNFKILYITAELYPEGAGSMVRIQQYLVTLNAIGVESGILGFYISHVPVTGAFIVHSDVINTLFHGHVRTTGKNSCSSGCLIHAVCILVRIIVSHRKVINAACRCENMFLKAISVLRKCAYKEKDKEHDLKYDPWN